MSKVLARAGIVLFLIVVIEAGCASAPRARSYLDPARLAGLVSQSKISYVLLDVRTPGEFAAGHIPTAENLPVDRIRSDTTPWAKDSMIIVYCASGARASVAEERLIELGFTNVGNFGGIGSWQGDLEL